MMSTISVRGVVNIFKILCKIANLQFHELNLSKIVDLVGMRDVGGGGDELNWNVTVSCWVLINHG